MSRRGRAVVVLLAALVVAGRAVLPPGRRFAGTDWLDAYGTEWFFWWTGEALLHGRSLGHTDLLFYPWGKDVYLHTGTNLLDAVLALPLRLALGPVAGMDLWVLLLLLGNAWAGARVARALGAGPDARLAAALVALCWPFALGEIQRGRPTQAMLVFLGLWVASLIERPTPRRGVLGGLWLGLAGLGYWFYGLLGAVLGALALAMRLVAGPERGRELLRTGLAAAVSLAVAAPLAWPLVERAAADGIPGLLAVGPTAGPLGHLRLLTEQGDPQGLSVLALDGRVGALLDVDGLRFDPGPRVFGPVAAALALLGLAASRRARPVLLGALAAGLFFAFGPALVIGDRFVHDAAFTALYERVPLLRRWWWPSRALGLLAWPAAAGAAVAVERLAGRWKRRWARPAAAAAVALAAAGGAAAAGLLPLASWDAAVAPGIACLARAPEGAVVELPYALGQRPLYHQTVHHKPMLNGMLVTKEAFQPEGFLRLRRDNSFVAALLALGDRQPLPGPVRPEDRAAFEALGYRWVVVRREGFLRPRRRGGRLVMVDDWARGRRAFRELLGEPAWEDEAVAIYDLRGEGLACP